MLFYPILLLLAGLAFALISFAEDPPLDLGKPITPADTDGCLEIDCWREPLPGQGKGWFGGLAGGVLGALSLNDWSSEPSAISGGPLGSLTINPASGLPMIDGIGGFDVAGNLFGTNSMLDSLGSGDSLFGSHQSVGDHFSVHSGWDSDIGLCNSFDPSEPVSSGHSDI